MSARSLGAIAILARAAAVMLLTAGGVWWLLHRAVPSGPSVLLITIDSLRADALSLYGYPRLTSPVLDEFATRCYVFDQAFSQHYYTGPAHSSILTSLYPRSHGIFRNALVLEEELWTLADEFRRRGYRTGAIVNVSLLGERFNYDQGFGFFRYVEDYPEDGEDRNIIAQTVEWIGQPWMRHRPFFFWVHLNYTHSWYDPPPPFDTLFAELPEPERKMLSYYDLRKASEDGTLTALEVAWARNRYDGEVAYTDDWLGLLFDRLLTAGALERTIVVITADHGETFNLAQGRFGHSRHLQDEVTHIPLVIYVPHKRYALSSMRRIGAMVQQIDIAPTLVELTGGRVPGAFQGRSLLPLMRGEAAQLHEALILGAGREWHPVSVRTAEWKLIEHESKPHELYHLREDPGETVNVFERHPDVAAELAERLAAWRRRTPERVGLEPPDEQPSDAAPSETARKALQDAGYLADEAEGR